MMKLLPKNLESRISWDAIQDEFGSTEVIFIAFGNEGKSIFNPEAMATLWDLTEALEAGKQIEELNSITTATRMDNLDGFMDCLLYTSDAADDTPCVDLGGRRIIKKELLSSMIKL